MLTYPHGVMRFLSVAGAVCAVGFVFMQAARAAGTPDKPIPPGGVALLPPEGVTAFNTYASDSAAVQIVDVTGQAFTKALRLTTLKQSTTSWELQAQATTVAPIKKGDVCLAVLTMRVTQSGGGYGRTNIILENATSYNKSLYFEVSAGGAWKTFYAPFTAAEDEATGEAHINLHMGFPPQTVEVADIQVTDYGSRVKLSDLPQTEYTYQGREADAPWRKAAAARIDKYRKGNIVVKVVNARGKPVRGAMVRVQQTRHSFGFGTAVDNIFIQDRPDSARYRALTYALYNETVIGNAL